MLAIESAPTQAQRSAPSASHSKSTFNKTQQPPPPPSQLTYYNLRPPQTTTMASSIDRHVVPDTAPSSQRNIPLAIAVTSPDAAAAVAATPSPVAVVPATVDIGGALLALGASNKYLEAFEVIKSLSSGLNGPPPNTKARENAQEIFDAQGVGIILSSLRRFLRSERYVKEALRTLTDVTYYVKNPHIGKVLLHLKFLDVLLPLARIHSTSTSIQTWVVNIFFNLARHSEQPSRCKFGTEEVVQFVMDSMAAHPHNIRLVSAAVMYSFVMCRIPEVKDLLLEKGALQYLGAVVQNYRRWNDNEGREQTKKIVLCFVEHSKLAIAELIR